MPDVVAPNRADLEVQRERLVTELKSVDLQLSDKNRTAANGERMDDKSYQQWRVSALRAKFAKERQLADVKKAIRARADADGRDEDRTLLRDSFGIIRRAVFQGFEPTDTEQCVIDALARIAEHPRAQAGA